jgi:hypothetical protein
MAYVAFIVTLMDGLAFLFPLGRVSAAHIAALTLLWLTVTMVGLLALATATVAVGRGTSRWLAYPLALLTLEVIGVVLALALHPYSSPVLLVQPLPAVALVHAVSIAITALPGTVLYVYASNAKHRARLLRAAEAERTAETERLAQQRLQAELASINHDLVLAALRRSLDSRASDPAHADALLAIVAEYLRAAQQRGSTDPQRIVNAFTALQQACAAAPDAVEGVST